MIDPNALTADPAKYIDWRRNPRDISCMEKCKAGVIHLTNAEWAAIEADDIAIDKGHKELALAECGCCFVAKTKMGTLTYEVDYKVLFEFTSSKLSELEQGIQSLYERFCIKPK